MAIEGQVNNISDLVPTYPQSDDPVSQGDNHIRNIKKAIVETFPNVDGTVNASDEELNQLVGQDFPSDIADLQGRVDKNEQDIGTNTGNISDNTTSIADLEARLAALEGAGLAPHGLGDHTDVDTSGVQEGYVLAFDGNKWIPIKNQGGDMIVPITQPVTAGDFRHDGDEQVYSVDGFGTNTSATLVVPDGMVFCFEFVYGIHGRGGGQIIKFDVKSMVIDGKQIVPNGAPNAVLEYDSNGGQIWPGIGKKSLRVEESITIRATDDDPYQMGRMYIAGYFTEA